MEDDTEEKSKKTFKLLKAAASANRDLIFGYVGVKQWDDFADTFGANKKTKLPKMVIWDGDVEYFSVSSFSFFFYKIIILIFMLILVLQIICYFIIMDVKCITCHNSE